MGYVTLYLLLIVITECGLSVLIFEPGLTELHSPIHIARVTGSSKMLNWIQPSIGVFRVLDVTPVSFVSKGSKSLSVLEI